MASHRHARTTPRPIRLRPLRLAGLLAVAVAIAVALDKQPSASSSPSTAKSPPLVEVRPDRPRDALGTADGAIPAGTTIFDDDIPGVADLDPALRAALRSAAAAAGDGVAFTVDSGWRSRAYQQHLLDEAIARYGSAQEAARWVAPPDRSAHVSGDAIDLGSAAAAWLSQHGAAYELCQVYANEPWHYELRPGAAASGCPAMYADAAHDPRLQR